MYNVLFINAERFVLLVACILRAILGWTDGSCFYIFLTDRAVQHTQMHANSTTYHFPIYRYNVLFTLLRIQKWDEKKE